MSGHISCKNPRRGEITTGIFWHCTRVHKMENVRLSWIPKPPPVGTAASGVGSARIVQKDRSMEALIENGEEWMEPLLDFRNELADTRIPDKKHIYRDHRRMNGKIKWMEKDDEPKDHLWAL